MSTGNIIVISGPSGVGKTTLYKKLLIEFKDKIVFSVSATTRKPRHNERNGTDYYFLEEEEFLNKIEKKEFVEWAKVYHHYYGTLETEIERIIMAAKNCLLDIDIHGGMNIKKIFPSSRLIFILPPTIEELKKRIIGRNSENSESFNTRIDRALKELEYSDKYDYCIINDDLERAYKELVLIITDILK